MSAHTKLFVALAYADLRVRWGVARARAGGINPKDEFRGLYISDSQIDSLLANELGQGPLSVHLEGKNWATALAHARQNWLTQEPHGRLHELWHSFGLDDVEIDALLLTLLPEIDPRYERIFAYLQDDVTKKRPTVDLLLNLLTDSFDQKLQWYALFMDSGRLLSSRLLTRFQEGPNSEPTLLSQFIRPAPQLVAHLLGHDNLDSQLGDTAQLIWATDKPEQPNEELGEQLVHILQGNAPLIALLGGYGVGKQATALFIAQTCHKPLLILDISRLSVEFLPLALRDGQLLGAVLYLKEWDKVLVDGQVPAHLLAQLSRYPHPILLGGQQEWHPPYLLRPFHSIKLPLPHYQQRLQLWQTALPNPQPTLLSVANQFLFTPGQIRDAARTAQNLAEWQRTSLAEHHLLAAARAHSNQKLSTLATKIQPRYHWQDIVLPNDTLQQLKEMVHTVRHRPTVYETWGFDAKMALGKGLTALFAGESGTGKTMAADIIAHDLGLDLYKINLSTVVSKYIGETEKNLSQIFQEAETSNAILFFDEADALFGKRSEVKDSHDRYANIEISYLLQRMEAFAGIVILATNLRANLDDAFTRRLQFIIEFPFPEVADRQKIWQANTPSNTPLNPNVNFQLLAQRFRLAGGNIRNIILAAAFLAAEEKCPVAMSHLLHATRREYQKMGRLINETLFI